MKKVYFMLLALILSAITATAADWYLVGANYSWSNEARYKFTPTGNANEQSLKVASLSGQIKIKEANTWSTSFGSNGQKLKEGVLYRAGTDGGNISVDGTIADATITINTQNHTILVTGASAENDYTCVYLIGDFGSGWSEATPNAYPLNLKEGTTNTYVGHYTLSANTTYFKMKAGNYVYGTGGNDVAVQLGEAYTASQSGNAYSIGKGEYDFTYVLEKNADTGVLTVTSEQPVTYPEHFYVLGNVNGSAFLPSSATALTTVDVENGKYEGEINFTGADGTANSYFSFCTAAGATWTELGSRYGADAKDKDVVLGEAMTIKLGEDAFKIPVGTYKVAVDLKASTVTVTEVGNEFNVVYLVGNLDGTEFKDDITTHPLTLKSGTDNIYIGKYTFTTNAYIKLRAGNLVLGTGAQDVTVVSGTEYTATPAGDAYIVAAGEHEFTVVMNQNAREAKLTVVSHTEPVLPTSLYLIGNFNNSAFAANVTVALTAGENHTFTAEGVVFTPNPDNTANSYFQLCTASGTTADDWANVGTRYMAENPDLQVVSGTAYSILPASEFPNSWYVAPGTYDVAVDLVSMKITLTDKTPVTYPETLYIVGNLNGWDFVPTSTTALTTIDAENGLYHLADADGLFTAAPGSDKAYFGFCTKMGMTWEAAGTRYGAENLDTPVELGEPMPIVAGENAFYVSPGRYNLTVDLKKGEIIVSEGSNEFETVYMIGDFEGEGFKDYILDYPLELKAGTDNTYTGKYTLTTTAYNKLSANSYIFGTGGDDKTMESGVQYDAMLWGNAFVLAPGEYEFTAVVNQDARVAKFTVTDTSEPVLPTTLYLIGNFNNSAFAANVTVALTEGENHTFTAQDVVFTSNPDVATRSFFQFCTATGATADDWANVGTRYMAQDADMQVESEVVYNLFPATEFPNSWYVTPGTYDVSVTLLPDGGGNFHVTAKAPVIDYPELVVIGDFCDWHFADAVAMTRNENVYTATMETLNAGVGFKVAEKAEDDNWLLNWGGSDPEGGSNPEILVLNTETTAWEGSSVNFQVPDDLKEVTITFTYDTDYLGSIKVDGTHNTGVDNISVENGDVEYYNLQGIRVVNPRGGIFIRRSGNTIEKVAL